jgi:hypothetical protein
MVKKAFKPEQIINKLREAEVLLSQGATVGEVSRKLGITEQTYYRWRREYGGMRVEQAKRLKELDKETLRKYIGGSGLAAKLMFDRIMILCAPAFPAQPSSSKIFKPLEVKTSISTTSGEYLSSALM